MRPVMTSAFKTIKNPRNICNPLVLNRSIKPIRNNKKTVPRIPHETRAIMTHACNDSLNYKRNKTKAYNRIK